MAPAANHSARERASHKNLMTSPDNVGAATSPRGGPAGALRASRFVPDKSVEPGLFNLGFESHHLSIKKAGMSLLFLLIGGERGIRTLDTG